MNIGNYLVVSEENRILLRNAQQEIFPFRFEDHKLAEMFARRLDQIYGSDLGYLGHVEWLSGIQQIHQDIEIRWKIGDWVNSLIKRNVHLITYEMLKIDRPQKTVEGTIECMSSIRDKYLMNSGTN